MPTRDIDQISQLGQVLILGFAREGRSAYNFLKSNFPSLKIGIADAKHPETVPQDPQVRTFFGKKYLKSLALYPLVIKSAGITPHLPEIKKAKAQGVLFSSITRIFFETCPGKIIGVTGTKGKSTTTSLLYHVLSQNNQPAVLVGNIGKPSLDYLPQITPSTWVVCELSSYQLLDLNQSPHIAVLLNIYPDHLDYHKSMREYVSAKANIARFQTPEDYFIYNADNPLARRVARLTPAIKLPYRLTNSRLPTKLLGVHNQYNIMPSLLVAQILNLPTDNVRQSIASFTPLETRLDQVAQKNGVIFYADTLATIPEATIAAIEALCPATLIAGGHERYQKYAGLAKTILESKVSTLILFPATGPRIWQAVEAAQSLFPQYPLPQHFFANSMTEAVNLAFAHTPPGRICLLSPAAPSFTLFKDYKDEYDQYKKSITNFST